MRVILQAGCVFLSVFVTGVLVVPCRAAEEGGTASVASIGGELSPFADDPYFQRAQAYADAMLRIGRDTYGKVHSPAFVSTIDLRTRRMPEATTRTTGQLYSRFFRAEDCSTSANPMYHVDLYQLLFVLSELTGDPRYREAGEAALAWFFRNAQSPATGLMAWGEHLGWDLIEDRVTMGNVQNGKFVLSDIHEFYAPWIHWKTTYQVAPEAALRFARGLWEHQIYDHQTCEYSRHARYCKHAPGRGYEFARQAGFYLDTWASLYQQTGDPELLTAIDRFLAAWERWRNPRSGLLPFEGKSPDVVFVLHNLAFAVDGWEASTKLPEPTAQRLQRFILSLDDALLKLQHELGKDGRGFAKIADANSGEVTNRSMARARPNYSPEFINQRYSPYGGLWASMYGAGSYTDARHGLLCFYRWQQTQRDGYKTLALAVADRYLDAVPDVQHQELTPKTLAPVMAVLNGAFRLSGQQRYRDQSESLARLALQHLFDDRNALPYATQYRDEFPYYASISYGDSLMLMFLELALLRHGCADESESLRIQCSIR